MISKIQLLSDTINLKEFSLENLPPLLVIAGANGSGKTALLNLIYKEGNRSNNILKLHPNLTYLDKIKYIKVGYVPGDIAPTSTDPRKKSEENASKAVDFISSGRWNTGKKEYHALALETLQKFDDSIVELNQSASDLAKKLSQSELWKALPSDLTLAIKDYQNNEFIAEVCVGYSEKINSFKLDSYDSGERLTEEEIVGRIGANPPWVEINDLFEKYGFSYRLTSPIHGVKFVPEFKKIHEEDSVGFKDLSSGEKIIVTLVLWGFNSRQSGHFKLLLLDEFDAHLNPSFAKMMMEIISDIMVSKNGLNVIMTTHSPSTVAYTNDENLFWMEADRSIRPATKAEIIPLLSDGFIAFQPNQALGMMQMVINESDKPILCVEGKTDKKILKIAWNKINSDVEMPFVIHDVFDCYFLSNMFKRGHIFDNYPDTIFLGLLDFDSAYTDVQQKLKGRRWIVTNLTDPVQVVFSHSEEKGSLLTLPVPEIRSAYAGPNIVNSYLSIELLFEDDLVESYCTSKQVAGGATLLKFIDKKKVEFSDLVESFSDDSFSNFEPLFNQISELIQKHNENS